MLWQLVIVKSCKEKLESEQDLFKWPICVQHPSLLTRKPRVCRTSDNSVEDIWWSKASRALWRVTQSVKCAAETTGAFAHQQRTRLCSARYFTEIVLLVTSTTSTSNSLNCITLLYPAVHYPTLHVTQFHTQFTHVSRQCWALNRKQKK